MFHVLCLNGSVSFDASTEVSQMVLSLCFCIFFDIVLQVSAVLVNVYSCCICLSHKFLCAGGVMCTLYFDFPANTIESSYN